MGSDQWVIDSFGSTEIEKLDQLTLTLRWTQPSFEQSPCDIEKESSLWLRLCDILSIHASRTPCDSVPKVLEI